MRFHKRHDLMQLILQLAKFLGNLTFPIVCANFKTNDTAMNAVNIKPYTIIEKHNLGFIGVITPDTKGTSICFPVIVQEIH
jgi:2',3'-cyclic-nucleotide 2'-phosphodiesterase (5'-nucleotidase family)